MNLKFIRSVFLQFSTIVGAGIFTLPYLFYSSNYYFAVIGLIIIALITVIINLFYIDIVNATATPHQLSGYAQIYLGRRFKILAAFNLLLICIGSIFAYNYLASHFLTVFFPTLNFRLISFLFLFLVMIIYLISKKKPLTLFDFFPVLVIFISLLLFSLSLDFPIPSLNLRSPNLAFVGATIFALSGFTIIPELEKRYLFNASTIGLFLATLLYVIFTYAVITLSGSFLSADTISGINHASPLLASIVAIFGILITFKGSLNMLAVFYDIFHRDFNLHSSISTLLTLFISFVTVAILKLTLSDTISLLGSITVSTAILIICFIRLKLPQTNLTKITVYSVIVIFSLLLFATLFM